MIMKETKKEHLVTENIKLIYLVMKRFKNRGIDTDDLFQIGAVGLTKAAERFDESKGYAFSTYAVPMIIGEIQRFIRDDGMLHISRKIKDDARTVISLSEKWKKTENTEISLEKLEKISGLSKHDIIMAMDAYSKPVSMENESVLDYFNEKTSADDSECEYDKLLNRMALSQAFDKLNENEKRIIYLRYVLEKTQSQVAETLGKNQVAISREEKRILKKLRAYITCV